MRSVFSTADQAIHVWSTRSQCGRNRSGNVFFDRASIWSYGNHFRMAQFVTNARGDVACLINPASYSRTTSKHQSMVRRAVPSYIPTFSAPDACIDHVATLAYHDDESTKAWRKASRARRQWSIDHYMSVARGHVESFNKYAEFFNLPQRIEMAADVKGAIAAAELRDAERERVRELERKRQERKDRATMRQWVAGADVRLPYTARDGDIRLRIRGDIVQTSHGAEVPVAVAPMLWEMIERAKQAKTAADYSAQDIRVGHFQLREIRANGDVQIGCHFLRYAELKRIAAILFAATGTERIAA